MPNLVRRAAHAFADREFVLTTDGQLTFAEAERQSRLLAKRLVRDGVTKGTRVGILFPQGPEFVVALFAVTRIGAVAVPQSTFARAPELRRALSHVDVEALIAPDALLGRDVAEWFEDVWPALRGSAETRLLLDDEPFLRRIFLCGDQRRPWATGVPSLAQLDDCADVSDATLGAIEHAVAPSDWMVIVSTSGATAEPKAVIHTHGAQVRQAWKLAQVYEFTGEERTFTTMPFFWTGGLTVVLLTHLQVGAAVITVARTDSREMLDLVEKARPTRLAGWTLRERLTADPTFADRDLSWFSDVLNAPPVGSRLRHSSLGMSETCGPHTVARPSDNAQDLPEHLQGSFGPPMFGMEHKIVDQETGHELADGVEGEICVRGDCLMEGLYKRERRETFDDDGWYHTGDTGYFRDGLLFFTGRRTEMIKTGGANVAPREVELVVESLPGVKAAFVVGIPDVSRGQVVGCVVCADVDGEIDPASITTRLSEQLSSYKIPRRILVVPYDEAPWLPSGKINKPRLVDLFTQLES
jgi:acyl-CoA synthetase (AMP-forming)/AMP-acid ligase II